MRALRARSVRKHLVRRKWSYVDQIGITFGPNNLCFLAGVIVRQRFADCRSKMDSAVVLPALSHLGKRFLQHLFSRGFLIKISIKRIIKAIG